MTDHTGVEALEVERKYEVDVSAALPGPETFAALGLTAEAPVVHELEAHYFDTPDLRLAQAGFVMRMRRGGKDAGWHLKERRPEGVRELMWPPAEEVPEGLVAEVRARIGADPKDCRAIAQLRTERTIVMLRDAVGREVVELADDRVLSEDRRAGWVEGVAPGEVVRRAWREWEAELMTGADAALLDAVEPVLLAAGAVHSPSPSKIARATGRLIDFARWRGASDAVIAQLEAPDASDQEAARRLEA